MNQTPHRWKCEWVGADCGHHSTYTFYKGVKYVRSSPPSPAPDQVTQPVTREGWRVLSLGQFFFVKIWAGSDLLSVAELQLLWEDKSTGQMMGSVRLYFLPEYTVDGRQPHHGEDELVAVAEKSVLRVPDLLDWIANPETVAWDRGTRGVSLSDCEAPGKEGSPVSPFSLPPDHKLGPGPGLDLSDIEKIKAELGDCPTASDPGVLVLSSSQYCRFRGVVRRLDGCQDKWLRNTLVVALGGFATRTRNTFVMFAKETFDYPELEEHPLLCNHLAPKLKGRPRKRRKLKEVTGSPNSPDGSEHESNSSEGSNCSGLQNKPQNAKSRKDLLAILSQKNTRDETEFLKKLIKFMEERNTPIERPPMLGFKQIDLHMFYQKVCEQGGYDGCVSKKAWKSVYDELGGNPQNTSAATCTRRHYEKFLLSYEQYSKNMDFDDDELKLEEREEGEEHGTNGTNGAENLTKDDSLEAKEEKLDEKPKENFTPKIGIKPLQMLTEPTLGDNADRDKEDVKMKIDDLIIIPNNHVEEGGSALQNLAKIASRYSSLNKDKSRSQDFSSPSPKKSRQEESKPSVAQPLPPTTAPKKGLGGHPDLSSNAATSLLQQFSLLSPGMFSGWPQSLSPGPPATTSSTSSSSNRNPTSTSSASAAGWLGTGLNLDPSKIGPDGYNLLKYYEQQLKALQQGNSSASKVNGVKEPSPSKKESKNKEKSKVSKLPPDTKRPPRLIQTPCPYSQTASIYGSPKSELQKAKDSAAKSGSNSTAEPNSKFDPAAILDLSSSSRVEYQAPAVAPPPRPTPPPPAPAALASLPSVPSGLSVSVRKPSGEGGAINLSTTSAEVSVDLSVTRAPPPVKPSPFSAEALLSKPSSGAGGGGGGSGGKVEHKLSSPALPRASPSQERPQVSSPWHSPAPPSAPSHRANTPRSTPSSLAALYSSGYLPPASSLATETTFSSLSSLSSSSLAPGSNPYLSALMSPSLHQPKTPAPAAASFPGLSPLDPASQYYAALYQQQLQAYQHAASAAALGPYGARPPGYPPTAGAAAELQALQQYKSELMRAQQAQVAQAQAQAQAQQAQAQVAAAANPYAALYGLMGYSGGFPGRKDPS